MGPLIAVLVAILSALVALGVWRGRLVSIALAGAECPDCQIPLVRVPGGTGGDPSGHGWEVQACPECDHLVTTVGLLPSPLADCPACTQRSLVVYAERADGLVVVDEWCDLCGRRARTSLGAPPVVGPTKAGVRAAGRADGQVLPFRRR